LNAAGLLWFSYLFFGHDWLPFFFIVTGGIFFVNNYMSFCSHNC
jgi:hypothetical protein